MSAHPPTKVDADTAPARPPRNLAPHGLLAIHAWMREHGDAELAARARAAILATDAAVTDMREEDGLTPHQVAERVVTPLWRAAHTQQAAADVAVTAVFDTWTNRQLEAVRHTPGHFTTLCTWLSGAPHLPTLATGAASTLPMARLHQAACGLHLPARVRLLYAHGNTAEYAALREWQKARAQSVHAANTVALAVHALLHPLTQAPAAAALLPRVQHP